jgi:ATP-dependent DNA ligase
VYYAFDVMVLSGRDVMGEPLATRRALLEEHVLPRLAEPVRYSVALQVPLPSLIQTVFATDTIFEGHAHEGLFGLSQGRSRAYDGSALVAEQLDVASRRSR